MFIKNLKFKLKVKLKESIETLNLFSRPFSLKHFDESCFDIVYHHDIGASQKPTRQ